MLYHTLLKASQFNVNHVTDYNFDITKISVKIMIFSLNLVLFIMFYVIISQ